MSALLLQSAPVGAELTPTPISGAGFEFAQPEGLAWLVAAAGCVALLAWLVVWRRRARARLADAALLQRIAPHAMQARSGLRVCCLGAAIMLLVPALMDPRAGTTRETVEQRSSDVMVVIDVSRSMLAEDVTPNRLARAKQFAADLVEAIGSDRVGLIEFAGVPSLRCPLTFNHRTFRVQLDALSPQSTVRGGSMLGDAIRLAASSLAGEGAGKAIVILSDGEDMQSEPVEAAAVAAKEQGIRVVTIGIGDATEGARIPVYERGQRRYIVHEGQEVWSRMDPKLLKQVADAGEGYFVEAGVAQADMDQLGRLLSGSLEKSTRERSDVSTKQPLFQLFAGAVLVLLLAEMLLAPRVRRDASSTTVAGSTPS
jgi:Ca-activated chloride channel family protein